MNILKTPALQNNLLRPLGLKSLSRLLYYQFNALRQVLLKEPDKNPKH